ncbi:MAG TPA: hypothetical protein VGN20_17425 [Mucilaginibacter sp.]|jgi:hypothetical protein
MKVVQLSFGTPHISLKRAINFDHFNEGLRLPFQLFSLTQKISNAFSNQLTLKSTFTYLFNAAVEGLKQNLLGPNINMEFFMLTARVYFIASIRLAAGGTSIISQKFIL